MKRFQIVLLVIAIIVWATCTLPYITSSADSEEFSGAIRSHPHAKHCRSVDVVYTWVNGSASSDAMLYRDYGTLRYSMRSVMTYAPWIRQIILVTNGEIPVWLNISHPRIRLVTHQEYYGNKKWLPTFNSNAIESQFYRLSNTAECFFYLNDDVLFANHIRLSDYINEWSGVQQLDQWDLVAPHTVVTNDGNRAAGTTLQWHQIITDNNKLINDYYHNGVQPSHQSSSPIWSWLPWHTPPHVHHYAGHECHFFQRRVLDAIVDHWPAQVNATASHTHRNPTDVTLPFMYAQVALHEFDAHRASRDGYYMQFTDDPKHNQKGFDFIRKKKPNCICLNDRLGYEFTSDRIKAAVAALDEFFTTMFPHPAPFELPWSTSPLSLSASRHTLVPSLPSPPSVWPTLIYVPFTYVLIGEVHVTICRIVLLLGWASLFMMVHTTWKRSTRQQLKLA